MAGGVRLDEAGEVQRIRHQLFSHELTPTDALEQLSTLRSRPERYPWVLLLAFAALLGGQALGSAAIGGFLGAIAASLRALLVEHLRPQTARLVLFLPAFRQLRMMSTKCLSSIVLAIAPAPMIIDVREQASLSQNRHFCWLSKQGLPSFEAVDFRSASWCVTSPCSETSGAVRRFFASIVGSSGVGFECVKRALSREHEVTLFSRSASHTDLSHERLKTVDGDALILEYMIPAVPGARADFAGSGAVYLERSWLLQLAFLKLSDITGLYYES